jgi:hypothetical protein
MFIRGPNGEMMMMLLHIREPLAIAILGFQKKSREEDKKRNKILYERVLKLQNFLVF